LKDRHLLIDEKNISFLNVMKIIKSMNQEKYYEN